MENEILESAKEFGPGLYMFVALAFTSLSVLCYVIRQLYKDLKEAHTINVTLSEETLGSLKDVMAVLQVVKDHNPQVISQVKETERNIKERIDGINTR